MFGQHVFVKFRCGALLLLEFGQELGTVQFDLQGLADSRVLLIVGFSHATGAAEVPPIRFLLFRCWKFDGVLVEDQEKLKETDTVGIALCADQIEVGTPTLRIFVGSLGRRIFQDRNGLAKESHGAKCLPTFLGGLLAEFGDVD